MKASLSAIKESPVPIRFELRPISELFQVIMIMMMMMMMISELFQEDWLAEHGLNASLLREYFDRSSHHYCEAGGYSAKCSEFVQLIQL